MKSESVAFNPIMALFCRAPIKLYCADVPSGREQMKCLIEHKVRITKFLNMKRTPVHLFGSNDLFPLTTTRRVKIISYVNTYPDNQLLNSVKVTVIPYRYLRLT